MGVFDSLSGGAYNTAYKNNMQTINTGLTQQSTALGDNYTSANNYLLGQGLDALTGGYVNAQGQLATGYGNQRVDINQGAQVGQGQLGQYYGQAADALNSGYGNALSALGSGYGNARTDLTTNYGQARTDLSNQYGETQGYLGRATANYQPLIDQTAGSVGQYENAIGANGAAGSQAASQAFTAAPGYQYALDQATGAVQRSAAARGGLAGGNATADILNTANGLASQGYQQYVNNLQNSVGMYTTGLSGQNAALTNQANASQSYGNALGNVDTSLGNALSGLDTGLGQAQASIYGQQGQALGSLYSNQGNQLLNSSTNLGTNLGGADANLGTGLGNLAVGQGTGTLGVYGQVGTNLTNLGNQENAAIMNATKMYVDNQNQKAKAQTEASGNLLGTITGGIKSLSGLFG